LLTAPPSDASRRRFSVRRASKRRRRSTTWTDDNSSWSHSGKACKYDSHVVAGGLVGGLGMIVGKVAVITYLLGSGGRQSTGMASRGSRVTVPTASLENVRTGFVGRRRLRRGGCCKNDLSSAVRTNKVAVVAE
jgi:hypothetical protein